MSSTPSAPVAASNSRPSKQMDERVRVAAPTCSSQHALPCLYHWAQWVLMVRAQPLQYPLDNLNRVAWVPCLVSRHNFQMLNQSISNSPFQHVSYLRSFRLLKSLMGCHAPADVVQLSILLYYVRQACFIANFLWLSAKREFTCS